MTIFGIGLWQIAVWLIPIIGIPGLIVIAFLYPGVVAIFARALVKFFSIVLSYRIGCAVVAAIVVGFVVDYWRHSRDDAEFAERTAAFEQAQTERDERVAKSTETLVRKQIADDWIAEQGAKKDVEDFKDRLPPDDAFRVGGDVDKLRAIAGSPVSGPPKGVPQAAGQGAAADHRVGNRLPRAGRRGLVSPRNGKPSYRRQRKV